MADMEKKIAEVLGVTEAEYDDFLYGGEAYDKVERHVRLLIGDAVFDFLEEVGMESARPVLLDYLYWLVSDIELQWLREETAEMLRNGQVPQQEEEAA